MKTKNLFRSMAKISSLRESRSKKLSVLSGSAIAGLATIMFSASANAQFIFSSSTSWQDFTIISSAGLTNTGPTVVAGNIALFPNSSITGFYPPGVVVNGTVYSAPNPISREIARIARTDAMSAYTDLQSAPTTSDLTGNNLGTYNGVNALTPGVYSFTSGALLTGTLQLNANTADSVFIFKITSDLITGIGSNVAISGVGADCAKVYWQVGSSATIEVGSEFFGSVIANTSVVLRTGATLLTGRAIALTGSVILDSNDLSSIDTTCTPVSSAFPVVTASMLTAEELTAIFQMGFSGAATQNQNIQRHLESVRRGGGTPPARYQAPYQNDSKSGMNDSKSGMSDSKGGMNDSKSGLVEQQVVSEGKERLWSAYLEATDAWSKVGSGANAYNFDTRGATLGVDRRIGDNFVFGILGSYNTMDANFSNSSSIEGESYKGALYATYFKGGFFVDALLGAGSNSYETSRVGFLGLAEGETDGWELDAMLNTGYDIHKGNWTITPFASLAFTRVTIDGFTETGSASPLIFPTQSQDSLRSDLGVKLAYSVALDNGMIITPQMRLAWQHEYLDSTQSIDSSFVSAPGSPFTVNGPAIGRDRAILSAGLNVQLTPTVNVYAYYDGQLGGSNLKYNSVTVGVMVEF